MHTSSAAATGAAHARAAALSLVLWLFLNTPTTCGFQATTMMVARASWKEYWLAKNGAKNAPTAVPSTRGAARRSSRTRWEPTRPAWWIAKSPAKVQGAPPVLATPVLDGGSFDKDQITDVLQHEYRHNLVRVAQKYDSLIESVEGVDAITIKELDGWVPKKSLGNSYSLLLAVGRRRVARLGPGRTLFFGRILPPDTA